MTALLCALISSVHLPNIFLPSTNLCQPAVVSSFLASLITASARLSFGLPTYKATIYISL